MGELVPVGRFGVQFPSAKDMRMVQIMGKRRDIPIDSLDAPRGRLFLEALSYALISIFQQFWQDARLSHSGHKVRISCPTRNDMDVYMFLHARPGSFANICTHIESLRAV